MPKYYFSQFLTDLIDIIDKFTFAVIYGIFGWVITLQQGAFRKADIVTFLHGWLERLDEGLGVGDGGLGGRFRGDRGEKSGSFFGGKWGCAMKKVFRAGLGGSKADKGQKEVFLAKAQGTLRKPNSLI